MVFGIPIDLNHIAALSNLKAVILPESSHGIETNWRIPDDLELSLYQKDGARGLNRMNPRKLTAKENFDRAGDRPSFQ